MPKKMIRKRMLNLLLLLSSIFLLIGCSSPEETAPSDANVSVEEAEIVIEDAWSRSTPELMDGSGIVYMRIKNDGNTADRLLAAKTDVCEVVELHEHVMDSNGVMRMRMIDGGYIDIPAGGEVVLKPGGLHLMLVNLKEGLKAGTTYALTLKFEKTGEITLEIPVFDDDIEN